MSVRSEPERIGGSKSNDERVLDDNAAQRVKIARSKCEHATHTDLRRVNKLRDLWAHRLIRISVGCSVSSMGWR